MLMSVSGLSAGQIVIEIARFGRKDVDMGSAVTRRWRNPDTDG